MAGVKLFKYVIPAVFSVLLALVLKYKVVCGLDVPYKAEKQKEMLKTSTVYKIQTALVQTITDLNLSVSRLQEKSGRLEAINQRLQERVDGLVSENDRLGKICAQLMTEQSAMEEKYTKLKKKVALLEVAYKKLSVDYKKLFKRIATVSVPGKPFLTDKKEVAVKEVQEKPKIKVRAVEQGVFARKGDVLEGKKDTRVLLSPQEEKPLVDRDMYTLSAEEIKRINEKGIEYGKKGMYDEAIKEFQKIAAVKPEIANVHYNLGLAYKKKGMLSHADKEFAEYERLKNMNN